MAAKFRFAEVIAVVGAEIDTERPVMLMSEPMIWTPPAAPQAAIPPPIASIEMLCMAFIETDIPLSVMPLRPLLLIDPGLLSEISDRLLTLVCPMLCKEVPVVEVSRMLSAFTLKLRASIDTVSEVWVMTLSPCWPLTLVVILTPSIVIDCWLAPIASSTSIVSPRYLSMNIRRYSGLLATSPVEGVVCPLLELFEVLPPSLRGELGFPPWEGPGEGVPG